MGRGRYGFGGVVYWKEALRRSRLEAFLGCGKGGFGVYKFVKRGILYKPRHKTTLSQPVTHPNNSIRHSLILKGNLI